MNTRVWLTLRFWLLLVGLLVLLAALPALAQSGGPQALVLTADGPINPAMAGYLERGLRTAEQNGSEVVIFELNTPGGSLDLMNRMVQDIRGSRTPVVVYVSPRGAWAGSAGTLITLAGHAAAMAPETSIGAASPVDATGQDLDQTMQAKEKNILKATVRSLASQRSPEAVQLAESTIESAKAASAQEALDVGLVDFIASDVNDLLRQLDGFKVTTEAGERALNTADAVVTMLPATIVEQVLAALTNPNIVALLLNIGVVAILIEISTPGGWVSGFLGVICLALASYGLGVLPVNWFGMVFLVLAFVLFILDIKAPTHGALTAAGVGSLIVGVLVLFNTPNVPIGFPRVSIPLVVVSSTFTGALFFGVMLFALKAQKIPIRTGQESIIGQVGVVTTDLSPKGIVHVDGEHWSARVEDGDAPLEKGARVQVVRLDGLTLLVRKVG